MALDRSRKRYVGVMVACRQSGWNMPENRVVMIAAPRKFEKKKMKD
jgi:hypothetical protein